jgi:hypothetical protein
MGNVGHHVGNAPTGINMAPRRKAPRRRPKKDAADAGKASQSFLKGDIKGGLSTLSNAFKTNKDQMVRIGAGALAAKLVVSSLGGSKILGAIGPLKLRA